ncbi:hypothetical protein GUJ93_ZPchr0003g16538 [Zizania palustris]|uniref:Pre-mRNA polyadenylation factor Fip1 domain-containing protein n=1 Tax=Zizania palustris TaxID=103762 RepID=A0A8J5RVI9_ZIZPA|nr:hypothetical protein GUJ93_ZPchr0003g16538 [Zizania palustris]
MDMADPVSAAAAAAANDEDVEDLYADLDDHVAAALAAVGESGGSIGGGSDPANDGDAEVSGDHTEADANEAVDLGDVSMGYISSDEESEDDIHILLNEDDSAPPPPPAGRCEERWVEREEGDVSGSCVEGPSINDVGRGKIGGLHSKGLLEKTIVPTTGQGDQGHHHAFQRECSFFLPRNMTVFDLDIEAFQHKPWRQHGVDLTDYFNFGLDEEGWRRYCVGMEHYRHGARTLANESSGLEQGSHYNLGSSKLVLKSVTYPGLKESNELAKVF